MAKAKKKSKKSKKKEILLEWHDLVITYFLDIEDEDIEDIVRVPSMSSGYSLMDGGRDLIFVFRTRKKAEKALERVKKKYPKKVRGKIYSSKAENEEDGYEILNSEWIG